MNFAQLEYFLTIAQTGSFSGASEHAHTSQSSLSKQIKSLEQELGQEVFVRDSSGVSLTPAGEIFLQFALKTLTNYKDVRSKIAQYDSCPHRRVRVGALPLLSDYGLSAVLADFQLENLDIQVDLYEREQANLMRRLELGQIDLAIVRTDFLDPAVYAWIPLAKDELVIVTSASHPLTEVDSVALSALKSEKFVHLDKDSALRTLFEEACRRSGFIPNVIFSHSRHEPLLSAIERGIGISALPRALSKTPYPGDFAYTDLHDHIYTEIGLVHLRKRDLTGTAQLLFDFFCTVVGKEAQ